MLAEQHFELSLIEREKRKHSVFRPPKFVKAAPPQKKTLTATARPWSPVGMNGATAETRSQPPKTSLAPPVALGLSPVQKPKANGNVPPALGDLMPSVSSNSSLFSPLSTHVSTFFHTFTEEATEEQVYPLDMFMSVRKDASHTPHGVLKWCVRQYLEIPTLKVPPHLCLSMNEAVNSDDGVTRGALGSGLKSKLRNKPVRQTHHKVMSVLSRITRAKYKELLEELLQLPLRQSDDAELQEIVKVFFDKSVQEHEYSDLYAQLVKELCSIKENERELDPKLQDRLLCNRIRVQLVAACEEQFRRPIELSPDEKVDRTTGKPFGEEEIEMKRMRTKNRLVGNIKFVGELYKLDLVTDRVVENILTLLVGSYNPAEPTAKEEYVFEVFSMLIKTTASILKDHRPYLLSHFLGVAKAVERSHTKPRVRFLMMDLAELNAKHRWVPLDRVMHEADACEAMSSSGPKQTSSSPLASSGGPNGLSGFSASGSYSRSLLNNRATSFAYDDAAAHSAGSPHTPAQTPSQHQRAAAPQPVPSHPQHPTFHAHPPQPLSSLPMSADASTSDFVGTFGLPRSRSSAASLQQAGVTANASSSGVGLVPTPAATPTALAGCGNASANSVNAAAGRHGPSASSPLSAHASGNAIAENSATPHHGHSARALGQKEASHGGRLPSSNSVSGFSPAHQSSHASPTSFTPVETRSPFTPAISASDLSSARTSEGARTPMSSRQQRFAQLARHAAASGHDVVNLQDITHQLMEMYNDPAQAANVVHCISEMALRNKVLCLTWWLRLVATTTSRFTERQRVTNLLSDLLSACPTLKTEELSAAIVEWMRFDIEQGLYDSCPRMFDNIAHMVLYCHSAEVSHLKHIEVVRQLLHAGLFNVMLHELTTDRGTDQMVTLVKSAHPVSMTMMAGFGDPSDDAGILRLAAENRFRLLPYFLSVSNGTESELPGTPASSHRTPTTPSMRSPLGDSITSTQHYDPLSRCLSFPRVAEDPEMQLFRKIRTEALDRSGNSNTSSTTNGSNGITAAPPAWRDEAVKLALAPVGNGSVVSQVIQVMKVVGALLACTSVTHHSTSLVSFAEVDGAVKEVLSRRPGAVFEAAAIMELMLHFTQALSSGGANSPRRSTRIKPLRLAFARWCTQGIVDKSGAMGLVRAAESTAPNPRVFTTYYNAIADADQQWHSTLGRLS